MATSNFPNGFADGVTIRGQTILNTYSGNVYWVDSNNPQATAGGPGTLALPFNTIDNAMASCTAGNGDIIMVAAGHAETISAAGGLTCDISGVSIIGLGSGANRPVLTFSATGSSVLITAASVTIENIVGTPSVDSVTNPFHLQAADCGLFIEWRDASSTVEAVRAILTTAAADNLVVDLEYKGDSGGNAVVNAIRCVGVNNGKINVNFYGVASTAIVEFITTACTNMSVTGYWYNVGTSISKDVIDTVGTSTWMATGFDGVASAWVSGGTGGALAADDVAAVAALLAVPSADVTTNTNERDVIGNKTDAAVTAVGTTKSIAAYAKGLVTMNTVQSADSTNNAFAGDVVGNKTDAAVYTPSTTKSIAAYAKGTANLQENVAKKAAATITNGQTLFTVAGGPIEILGLVSICVTGNDATASTLQYNATPTVGSAQTISAASASLANALAGASVTLAGTALSTAALYNANGANLIANPGTVMVTAGVITAVVGVGSTAGTWEHYLRYKPLAVGVTVS